MANGSVNKAGWAAAGVAGVAVLASPWLIGLRVEASFRDGIKRLSEQSPYPITVSRYARGYGSATAETRIEIPLPPEAADDDNGAAARPPRTLVLGLQHAISHGPRPDSPLRIARLVTTPKLDAELTAALQPLFGDAAALTLITDLGFGGALSGSLRSPAVDTSNTDALGSPLHLRWAGIDGEYSITGRQLVMRIDSPGLELSAPHDRDSRIGPMQLRADMQRIADGPLWAGTSTLAIASATFKTGAAAIAMEAVQVDSETRAVDGLMNSGVRFSAASFNAGGTRIDQLRLNLAVDHLDAAATSELSQAMNRYQQALGPDGKAADPLAMMAELKPVLGRLAAGHPEFRVDELSFGSPDGTVKLDGRLRYIGDANLDDFAVPRDLEGRVQFEAPLTTVNLLLGQKVRADMAESAGVAPAEVPPEVVASALAGSRSAMVAQGLLLIDGDRASSTMAFERGALTINGKTLGGPAP